MKKLLIKIAFVATFFNLNAQQTLTAVSLLRPGAASTILTTNGSGQVVWGNAASILTAGTGISISGNQIINTAPNQTVALTGGGIVSISGTYPNFTVSATEVDGSTTNELQTIAAGGTTSPTVTLSNSGGTITFAATGLATLSRSGNTITIDAASVAGSLSFFKSVMASAGTTVAVTGFTPTTTNAIVFVDGTMMEWGSGNDVTVAGTTLTFSRTLEANMKVVVAKIH
jgi:hypothetical protein